MPAHHTLEAYLDAYIEAAGIRDGGKAPLFRSAAGRAGTLTDKPMHRVDALAHDPAPRHRPRHARQADSRGYSIAPRDTSAAR
jgi:hypothetical protein